MFQPKLVSLLCLYCSSLDYGQSEEWHFMKAPMIRFAVMGFRIDRYFKGWIDSSGIALMMVQ